MHRRMHNECLGGGGGGVYEHAPLGKFYKMASEAAQFLRDGTGDAAVIFHCLKATVILTPNPQHHEGNMVNVQ